MPLTRQVRRVAPRDLIRAIDRWEHVELRCAVVVELRCAVVVETWWGDPVVIEQIPAWEPEGDEPHRVTDKGPVLRVTFEPALVFDLCGISEAIDSVLGNVLPADAQSYVGYALRHADTNSFELHTRSVPKQTDAASQQNWGDVQDDLIQQALLDALARKAAAKDGDVFSICGFFGSRDRVLKSTADEMDPALLLSWRAVGENEHLSGELAAVNAFDATPTVFGELVPATACDDGANAIHGRLGERRRRTVLTDPLHRVVRTGDEAIKRDRVMGDDACHFLSSKLVRVCPIESILPACCGVIHLRFLHTMKYK